MCTCAYAHLHHCSPFYQYDLFAYLQLSLNLYRLQQYNTDVVSCSCQFFMLVYMVIFLFVVIGIFNLIMAVSRG